MPIRAKGGPLQWRSLDLAEQKQLALYEHVSSGIAVSPPDARQPVWNKGKKRGWNCEGYDVDIGFGNHPGVAVRLRKDINNSNQTSVWIQAEFCKYKPSGEKNADVLFLLHRFGKVCKCS